MALLPPPCSPDADPAALRRVPGRRGRHLQSGRRSVVAVVAHGRAPHRQAGPACTAAHDLAARPSSRRSQVPARRQSLLDHMTSRFDHATQGGVPGADRRRSARVRVLRVTLTTLDGILSCYKRSQFLWFETETFRNHCV